MEASWTLQVSSYPRQNMLRDRLVCGVTDRCLQRRLLTKPELTLKDAVKTAIAQKQQKEGHSDCSSNSDYNRQPYTRLAGLILINNHIDYLRKNLALRYSSNNHGLLQCRFKDSKCHSYKKKRHLAWICCKSTQRRLLKAKLEEQINSSDLDSLIKWKQKRT